VAFDDLSVMYLGLGMCAPLLLGVYAALGVFLIAAPIVTVRLLRSVPGEVVRQYREKRAHR
jgi:hypothetical protein